MKLDELKHLPVKKGYLCATNIGLSDVPIEVANVEFKNKGRLRALYIRGIFIAKDFSNEAYLVWGKSIYKENDNCRGTLMTKIEDITNYKKISKFFKK